MCSRVCLIAAGQTGRGSDPVRTTVPVRACSARRACRLRCRTEPGLSLCQQHCGSHRHVPHAPCLESGPSCMPDGGRMFLPQGRGRGPGQRSGQGKRTGDNRLRIPRRHRSCAGKPQGRCSARLLPARLLPARLLPARLLCEDRKKTHCSVCPPKNSREQGGRNTLLRAFRLVLLLQHVPPHASGRLRGVATQTAHSLYTLRQGHKKSAVLKLNVLRKYSTRYRTEIVYRKIPLCARQKTTI